MKQPSLQIKVSISKKIIYVFKIVSTAIIFSYLYRYSISDGLAEHIKLIDYYLLAAGISLTVPIMILRAKRWALIVAENGLMMNDKTLFDVYVPSFTLGLVTPGRAGELIRCKYLYDNGISMKTSLITIFFDRMFDIIPTIFICALFSFYVIDEVIDIKTKEALLIASTIALAAFLLFSMYDLWKKRVQNKFRDSSFNYSIGLFSKCASLSMISIIFSAIQVYLFASSVELNVSPFESFGFASLSSCLSQLPIGIGGIGSRDLILVYLLEQDGNFTETAFLFAQTFNITFVCLVLSGLLLSIIINRRILNWLKTILIKA